MNIEKNNGGVRLRDRRENSRFPLQEEVRYRIVHQRVVSVTGVGRTLDISSSGVLFTTGERLQPGRTVEIAIDWPARLDGICPLQFVAVGRVVRSDLATAAVRIERYQFKTRARSLAASVSV
jgi:PilZ domain-containing protein